jgi:hypothetical protein
VRFRQCAAEDGEVLAEDRDRTVGDAAVAGDDAIAEVSLLVDAELRRPMRDERVELDEASGVQKQVESLAGRELAARCVRRRRLAWLRRASGADARCVHQTASDPLSLRKDVAIIAMGARWAWITAAGCANLPKRHGRAAPDIHRFGAQVGARVDNSLP